MKRKVEFSKSNSLALKGIAIIMMMFHHCFWKKELFNEYNLSFSPFNQEFVVQLSLIFKVCVSFFTIITGYGLMLSLKQKKANSNFKRIDLYKWIINRVIKVLSGFWIIAILSYIICQIINGRTEEVFFKNGIIYGVIKIIINFLGLSKLFKINNFNSAWWYMSIAILFVISVPIFDKLFKKYKYIPVLLVVIVIPRIMKWNYATNEYITFLFPLLLGMILAEKNLIVRFANYQLFKNIYMSKLSKFILETLTILTLCLLYIKLPSSLFWELKYGIIPVCFIMYLYEFILDIPILKNILGFLGKHSMNIFLIHEFIRTYYLTEYIYSYNNFIKIACMLLLFSLIISIIIEALKKIIKYDEIINKLQLSINKKLDKLNIISSEGEVAYVNKNLEKRKLLK